MFVGPDRPAVKVAGLIGLAVVVADLADAAAGWLVAIRADGVFKPDCLGCALGDLDREIAMGAAESSEVNLADLKLFGSHVFEWWL